MTKEIYKLQVEINQEQLAGLNELQDAGGLRTKKELLDNALTLLKWAVRQMREGNLIISMNPQTGALRELEVPYLEKAREMSAANSVTHGSIQDNVGASDIAARP